MADIDVEDRELFFGQIFADVALLLRVEAVRELQQFLEELLDVAAAVVVTLDQCLELLREVSARAVQAHELRKPRGDGRLERFQFGVLVLRLLEAFRERLEIDLREIDGRRAGR